MAGTASAYPPLPPSPYGRLFRDGHPWIWVNRCLTGLLLLVGFTIRLLVLGLTRLRRIADPELRTLLAGIISPLFGILALYVGGPATTSSPLAPYLWFVAGIMAYWLISRPDLRLGGRA